MAGAILRTASYNGLDSLKFIEEVVRSTCDRISLQAQANNPALVQGEASLNVPLCR